MDDDNNDDVMMASCEVVCVICDAAGCCDNLMPCDLQGETFLVSQVQIQCDNAQKYYYFLLFCQYSANIEDILNIYIDIV